MAENIDIKQLIDGDEVFYPQTDINALVNNGDYAIDDEPTIDSSNLVTSGGIASELALGAVYDVTAHNGSAQFASLQALLTDPNLSTLIPTNVRRGGMSIKFVSDNKYVQYRYMLSTYTAAQFNNTDNWQGIDDKPTAGSVNLVDSNSIYKNLLSIGSDNQFLNFSYLDGYVNIAGGISGDNIYFHSEPISLSKGDTIIFTGTCTTAMSAISKYIDDSYTNIVTGKNESSTYYYTAEEDIQVVISGISSVLPSSVVVKLSGIKSVLYVLFDKFKKDPTINSLGIEKLKTTQNAGYVRVNGTVATGGTIGYYTDPIELVAGEILLVYTKSSYTMSAIARETGESTKTPLVIGKDPSIFDFYYIQAEANESFIVSYMHSAYNDTFIYKLNLGGILNLLIHESIKLDSLNENVKSTTMVEEETVALATFHNGYINKNGEIALPSSTNFYYTDPILVPANTLLFIKQGTNPVISLFSKYENIDNEDVYTPLDVIVIGEEENQFIFYYSQNEQYIVFSGQVSKRRNKYLFKFATSGLWSRYMECITGMLDNLKKDVDINKEDISKLKDVIPNYFAMFDNIISIGDSLTYSQVYTSGGSRQAYSPWPKQIAKISGIENSDIYAVSGATSKMIWNTFKDSFSVPSNKKSIVTIYLGTNNWFEDTLDTSAPESSVETYRTSWADDFIGSLCKIIQTFKNFGCNIVIIRPRAGGIGGNPPEGWTLEDTNAVLMKVIDRFSCGYVDDVKFEENIYHRYPTGTGSNSLHYNDLGYSKFATFLIKKVGEMSSSYLKYLLPI